MQPIDEGAAQIFVFARGERCGDGAGVPAILHGMPAVDLGRQNAARVFGGDLEIRDQEDEVQLGGDREHLPLPVTDDVETAVGRRGGIIWMTLEFRTDFKNLPALERTASQHIQSMNHPVPNRSAASETTSRGDVAGDRTGKWEGLGLAAVEECVGGGANQRVDRPATPRNRDVVIEAKREPKAVEPRSEVGRARRNSDGDLLHDWADAPAAARDAILAGPA